MDIVLQFSLLLLLRFPVLLRGLELHPVYFIVFERVETRVIECNEIDGCDGEVGYKGYWS